MANPSVSLLNEVYDAVVQLGEATNQDLADLLDRHPTTVGTATSHHFKRGKFSRSARRVGGSPRETYFFTAATSSDATPVVESKPTKVKRASSDKVRAEILGRKKTFVAADIINKFGSNSRETVYRAIREMVADGSLTETGAYRHKSRVLRVSPQPVTESANFVTTELQTSTVQAEVAEYEMLVARHAADELRIAELAIRFNEYRAALPS